MCPNTSFRQLDFSSFDPSRFRILGSGLWGVVLDLSDGTIVKLAREQTAGIGSGEQKIVREFNVLSRIAVASIRETELIARPIGWGAIPEGTQAAEEGFDIWLRTTKIPGQNLGSDQIGRMTVREVDRLGSQLGEMLAQLHDLFDETDIADVASQFDVVSIRCAAADDLFALACLDHIETVLEGLSPEKSRRPIHGDFNISNVLFKELVGVGIIDFAEVSLSFPEKDFSDILKEVPSLRGSLVREYESASGRRVDPELVKLGHLVNALVGMIIAKRKGLSENVLSYRSVLAAAMENWHHSR